MDYQWHERKKTVLDHITDYCSDEKFIVGSIVGAVYVALVAYLITLSIAVNLLLWEHFHFTHLF